MKILSNISRNDFLNHICKKKNVQVGTVVLKYMKPKCLDLFTNFTI